MCYIIYPLSTKGDQIMVLLMITAPNVLLNHKSKLLIFANLAI